MHNQALPELHVCMPMHGSTFILAAALKMMTLYVSCCAYWEGILGMIRMRLAMLLGEGRNLIFVGCHSACSVSKIVLRKMRARCRALCGHRRAYFATHS